MHRLFALAALTLALFFAAAPAEAACASDGGAAVAAQSAADVFAVATGGHCQHEPCSDSCPCNAQCGCAGHSFVPAFPFESPRITTAKRRVVVANELSNGRSLLPPVPPPLA